MPKRTALVDYEKCRPEQCAPKDGVCPALSSCPRGILQQEAPYEAPFVFPVDMCRGCSDCVRACPAGAIRMG